MKITSSGGTDALCSTLCQISYAGQVMAIAIHPCIIIGILDTYEQGRAGGCMRCQQVACMLKSVSSLRASRPAPTCNVLEYPAHQSDPAMGSALQQGMCNSTQCVQQVTSLS
jgi:hypothetical protein